MSNLSRGPRNRREAAVVQGEPDVTAGLLVEFAERRERHEAAVLDSVPRFPVFALEVADVRRSAVRLHPEELLEIELRALCSEPIGTH